MQKSYRESVRQRPVYNELLRFSITQDLVGGKLLWGIYDCSLHKWMQEPNSEKAYPLFEHPVMVEQLRAYRDHQEAMKKEHIKRAATSDA